RFMPAISAAIARTPVIMLRRKFGRRTGGRPFSVVAGCSTTYGDRSPIYRARSVIYLCLFARALIGRSLCSSALRAYDARSLMDFSTGSPFPVSVVVDRHAWQRWLGGLLR